jgi:hypothetical protein
MSKTSDLLFDSSAIAKFYCYELGSTTVDYWLKTHNNTKNRKNIEKLSFYLPNICISELIKAIVDKYEEKHLLKDVSYLNMIATCLNDVDTFKYYFVCNITPKDLARSKDVLEFMYREFNEDILSPVDALILARALNMRDKNPNLYVAVDDADMKQVGEKLGLIMLNPRERNAIPVSIRPV